MLIRGISFEIPNEPGISLYDILSNIDIVNLNWYIEQNQTEVHTRKVEESFFTESSYSGDTFLSLIRNEHYLVFLKLYGLQDGAFEEIHYYEDFKKSNCSLLILINDCSFVEIYASNPEDVQKLRSAAEKNKYQDIHLITDNNDKRIKLDIL